MSCFAISMFSPVSNHRRSTTEPFKAGAQGARPTSDNVGRLSKILKNYFAGKACDSPNGLKTNQYHATGNHM